jgi:putative nucleotidyltransferase with HDIG domain
MAIGTEELIQSIRDLGADLATHCPDTAWHSARVACFAERVAQAMSLSDDDVDVITRSALLHDVGKLYLRPEIIAKRGPLRDSEWREIQRHPITGARIADKLAGFGEGRDLILYHHERVDGTGYPYGLRGDEIPVGARILAVADAYDAMTSDRPYRPAIPHADAVGELVRAAGTQFDVETVDAFCRAMARVESAA